MISCPWCGKNYHSYQSNCSRCGGPIPPSAGQTESGSVSGAAVTPLLRPPRAPRPISSRYAWQLLTTDAWAITAVVFGILGLPFLFLGVIFVLAAATAPLAPIFALLGLLFLAVWLVVIAWRYQNYQKIIAVLRSGDAVEGTITQVKEIKYIRAGLRRPTAITYQFEVGGRAYSGEARTYKSPDPAYQPGYRTLALYLPQSPQWNALYPHP